MDLCDEGAVDKQLEIITTGDNEERIFATPRHDGRAFCVLYEVDVICGRCAYMASQEKLSLVGDFEIIELVPAGAKNQACIVTREQ